MAMMKERSRQQRDKESSKQVAPTGPRIMFFLAVVAIVSIFHASESLGYAQPVQTDTYEAKNFRHEMRMERRAKQLKKGELAPIDTLVHDNEIVGNVQPLLDFAILGFGKCGTTTLVKGLAASAEIKVLQTESYHLSNDKPAELARDLHALALSSDGSPDQYRFGIKNPSDVRRLESLEYIREYWPKTKLIITVRSPMSWFKSLYDFAYNEMGKTPRARVNYLLQRDRHAIASTWKGEFHRYLSQLGKTDMTDPREIDLLQTGEEEIVPYPRMKNKVFLMEIGQLKSDNETAVEMFRNDLAHFLGLKDGLGDFGHVRPGDHKKALIADSDRVEVDLCSPNFKLVHDELMEIAKDASTWLREYFLKSPDVVVSNKKQLKKILMQWTVDPCGDNSEDEQGVSVQSLSDHIVDGQLVPLNTFVRKNKIIGNVQPLLDFAILGFGKCGTTTLVKALAKTSGLKVLATESYHLSDDKPDELVRDLHALASSSEGSPDQYLYGMKNPTDIRRRESLQHIGKYWPETKLIITVRSPMSWFKSLYEFAYNEMGKKPSKNVNALLNRNRYAIASTWKGEFHKYLAQLGKTDMSTPVEIDLLSRAEKKEVLPYPRMKNKVFLMEIGQLKSENATTVDMFRNDLAKFLGVDGVAEFDHVRPGEHKKALIPDSERVEVDLCSKEFKKIHKELMKMARDASRWLREYFLKSPDVVASNRKHLNELLLQWKVDPCTQTIEEEEDDDALDTDDSADEEEINEQLPSLSSLIYGDQIIGDVQRLLDFAILGFETFVTQPLADSLEGNSEVRVLPTSNHQECTNAVSIVKDLHALASTTNGADNGVKLGMVSAYDIRRHESLDLFRKYWPKTKLVIIVRHPIEWFMSAYEADESNDSVEYLIDRNSDFTASTWKAEYHKYLANLGKTRMINDFEIALIERGGDVPFEKYSRLENEIFFGETSQFSDENATAFRNDLGAFLGLTKGIGEVDGFVPKKTKRTMKNDFICSAKFYSIRRDLLQTARYSARWLTRYFLKKKDITVSNGEHLETILSTWKTDPCGQIKLRDEVTSDQ